MSYAEFLKKVNGRIEEKLEWRDLATFVPNRKLPVYGWFYYKEGFAKGLVEKLIEMFDIKEGRTVLDPFCGSGTTLLACKQHGIDSMGFDVLPVSVFATKVKTADYTQDMIWKIEENAQKIFRARFERLERDFPAVVRRAFSRYALDDIAFLKSEIKRLDPEVREFFMLALMTTALKCSYAFKDGSVIKFRRRPVPPLRRMYRRVVGNMIKDMRSTPESKAQATVDFGDARALPMENESVDAIITSPPYLNNIDYTKVYSIEEFFIYGPELPGVRAYIGLKPKESEFLKETDMPPQARLYFEDINDATKEMHRVLRRGGHAAIVVGNGYINEIIDSDLILAYLAEKMGFRVEKIYVLNQRFALEQRTIKKGTLRESLIILEKP